MNPLKSKFLRRVFAMARKEVAHVRRDPSTLYLAIGMPLVLICIFGFGVRFDADNLPIVVVDQDRGSASAALVRELAASGELRVVGQPQDVPAAELAIRSNQAAAALVIPRDYARELARGQPVDLQLLVDGTDGTIANLTLANSEAMVTAAALVRARRPPAWRVMSSIRYNPAGESALFLLPGTIAYVLALVSVLLTSLAIAREWERGSMEQLFATSVGTLEIVLGKLLPYLALGVFDVLAALAVGALVFDLPLRGSLVLVFFGALLFIVGMLGQGLFISIVTRSQVLATQLGALSAMLPSMLLSGFLFPVENLPRPMYLISHIVPARFLISLLRGVLLKGAGLAEHWTDLLALLVFAILTISASTLTFRRRIV